MKTLTLAYLLLTFCVTCSVAGPVPQSKRHTTRCNTGFNECKEGLNDFKEAEQFMQSKATVLAGLNRLAKSTPTKTKIGSGRDADVNRQTTGTRAVYSAIVGPIRQLSVQAASAVQPASLESTAGSKP